MTHLYAGMTGKTRGGYEFEVFASRYGYWFGVCFMNRAWRCIQWQADGSHESDCYTIPAPEPVKKWTDTELLDWAEAHPTAFVEAVNELWALAGRGYREDRFEWRAVIRYAAQYTIQRIDATVCG